MNETGEPAPATISYHQLLACELARVPPAMRALGRFLSSQGVAEHDLAGCELALAEACNNAIQNAPEAARHLPVEITVTCTGSELTLAIKDHTPGFVWPDKVELPDLGEERGRGLFLIQNLMDHADYQLSPAGNLLVLRKKVSFNPPSTPPPAALPATRNTFAQHDQVLRELAQEVCFLSDCLGAIFRSSAELGRSKDLGVFAQRLLTDLLRISCTDWFVLRLLPATELRLALFASSKPECHLECLGLPDLNPPPPYVELRAALQRETVRFTEKSLPADDPLRALGPTTSGLVLPVQFDNTLLGTLALGKEGARPEISKAEAEVVQAFGNILAGLIVNGRLQEEHMHTRLMSRELELAKQIQRSLLPKSIPQVSGFGVAGFCESAEPLAGDFYDVLQLSDHTLLLLVADVMGKGFPAAMFAAILHSLVRVLAEWTHDPAEILSRVNWMMYEELSAVDMFITAQLALVDTRKRRLTAARAGHGPLLLAAAGQSRVKVLCPEGMPLGILRTNEYENVRADLGHNCRLLLYTDGVTESRNHQGEQFGQEHLLEWLRQSSNSSFSAEHIKREFASLLKRFQNDGPLRDDQTFLLLAEELF